MWLVQKYETELRNVMNYINIIVRASAANSIFLKHASTLDMADGYTIIISFLDD